MKKRVDIRQLRGIERLGSILRKWHKVELFWSDCLGNIEAEGEVFSETFVHEIAKRIGELKNSTRSLDVFDSGKLIAVRLVCDGEYWGGLWGRFLGEEGMSPAKAEYLGELIALVGYEIIQFSKEMARKEEHIHTLRKEVVNKYGHRSMVGKSSKMRDVYSLLDKIATSEASVFIQGANGTGKELVAKAIHYDSPRKDKIFLAVNCSAFNENLLDSELFGHVRGAFTGAIKRKKGLFEQADGGTLFLDEVGDTSLSMQVKLLRALQEGTYLPVGAETPQKCNVRIIASTNRPIEKMMAEGKFREDLYYRLNVININLPSLVERMEDAPLLIDHFMGRKCKGLGVPTKKLSKGAMEKIFDYGWPGNVRELENELERLIVLSGDEDIIHQSLLAPRILQLPRLTLVKGGGAELETEGRLKDVVEKIERKMICEGLRRCSHNKSRLARELGISRANLISKVYKYGLEKRPVREAA